ncbi:MAG: hypothetical protein OXD29_10940 [Roseovarius sp.]|nr:hypothetical protein [Roseovarius sp.]
MSEKRYVCWAYGLRFALAFAGVGALASLLEESPAWLAPIAGAMIVAFVIVDLLWNGSDSVAQLKIVNRDQATPETRYRSLWDQTRNGTITDEEACAKKDELLEALNEIASNVDIIINEKISQKAQERAFKVEELRHAT